MLALLLWSASARAIAVSEVTDVDELLTLMKSKEPHLVIRELEALKAEKQGAFFQLLRQSLASDKWDQQQMANVENVLTYFGKLDLLMDPRTIHYSHCATEDAIDMATCFAKHHGAAYAWKMRTGSSRACWQSLEKAKYREREFRDGIRSYYAAQAGDDDGDVALCEHPPTPSRCRIAFCTERGKDKWWAGVSFRPAANLGVAVPLGTPKFGFPTGDDSVSLQATAGFVARGFIANGRVDLHAPIGLTNAVGADGESAAVGLFYGVGLGLFEGLFNVSLIGIVNTQNGDNGLGLAFAVDLVAIKDKLAE